jgi:hypothetical protein
MGVDDLDSDVLAKARRKQREMMLAQRLSARVVDIVLERLDLHHASVVDAACRMLDIETVELANKMKLVLDDPGNRRMRELMVMVIPTAGSGCDEAELDSNILCWCQLQAALLRYKAMAVLVYRQGVKDEISAEQEVQIEEWLHTAPSAPTWALRNQSWTT